MVRARPQCAQGCGRLTLCPVDRELGGFLCRLLISRTLIGGRIVRQLCIGRGAPRGKLRMPAVVGLQPIELSHGLVR